jgi:hypothetical protein
MYYGKCNSENGLCENKNVIQLSLLKTTFLRRRTVKVLSGWRISEIALCH